MFKYLFFGLILSFVFSITVAEAYNFKEPEVPHKYSNAMCMDYPNGAWKCYCLNWSNPSPGKKTLWKSTNPEPVGLGTSMGIYVNSNKCKPVVIKVRKKIN